MKADTFFMSIHEKSKYYDQFQIVSYLSAKETGYELKNNGMLENKEQLVSVAIDAALNQNKLLNNPYTPKQIEEFASYWGNQAWIRITDSRAAVVDKEMTFFQTLTKWARGKRPIFEDSPSFERALTKQYKIICAENPKWKHELSNIYSTVQTVVTWTWKNVPGNTTTSYANNVINKVEPHAIGIYEVVVEYFSRTNPKRKIIIIDLNNKLIKNDIDEPTDLYAIYTLVVGDNLVVNRYKPGKGPGPSQLGLVISIKETQTPLTRQENQEHNISKIRIPEPYTKKVAMDTSFSPSELVLLEALKTWRQTMMDKTGYPSYAIAKDETLENLVKLKPKTIEELAEIKGIGPAFLKKYSDAVLQLL